MPAILVVDDDPIHADYLATLLKRAGQDVVQAISAREALERLAHGGIGTVITDLLMPETDGIELLRAIRGTYPDVRVIGVTGCDPWLRQLARQMMSHFGLHDLLPKPIDATVLHRLVSQPA